jgi:Ser/Thr protein kinase RdoA (MazF antagonist)
MKKYDELTELGKKRRMHSVAKEAVKQYDIDVKSISYITEETNFFFKVTDYSGKKYALKICQEESSKIEDNLAEVFLIAQIAKNSDITVPEVLYSRDGKGIVWVEHDGFDLRKRVVMYNWLEGIEIDGREDDGYFVKLGEAMAKLHKATEDIAVPEEIKPKSWDKIFYYRDEVPVYKEARYQKFLTPEFHDVMDFIIPYLDGKLSGYYENASPQLIHADLNPYNMWTYKNEIRIMDFEEAMFAMPVHDIAIALFYYRYDDNFDYSKVYDLLIEGYINVKNLPCFMEYDTELLMTARRVNFLNYDLLVDDDPAEYIKRNLERVKEYIKKYV